MLQEADKQEAEKKKNLEAEAALQKNQQVEAELQQRLAVDAQAKKDKDAATKAEVDDTVLAERKRLAEEVLAFEAQLNLNHSYEVKSAVLYDGI